MTKRIALVTGANKGIGFETARQLAQAGVHVLLGARDRERGEAAAQKLAREGLSVESLALDVRNEGSIEAARKLVADKFGHLDILVNNAGVNLDRLDQKPSQQPLAAWRETFETNLFGLIAVTNAFLPLLRESHSGRIVNVSSILGSLAEHLDPNSSIYAFKIPAYNVSKSAVNAWTIHLAYELRDTRVKVNAIHPGYVQTDMDTLKQAPLTPAEGARTSVRLALLDDAGPSGGFFFENETLRW
jgi:NAD(P)-dependent dehydrogenase (short-subunit alcohol dehydrogenase family)